MTRAKRFLLAIAVVFTIFITLFYSKKINLFLEIDKVDTSFYWSIFGQLLKYIVPSVFVLLLFYKPKNIIRELGLRKGFLKGLQFAFLFTLPMLVGYFIIGQYNNELSFFDNMLRSFKDAFREEVFFRAFLFGQLFRQVKLGFLLSVFINALIFGLLHIYQAHSISESFGIFAVTFAGAIWFAWLYMEWKENLWLPIFMHFFMNFYWDLFSTEKSALGGLILNIPRLLTIAISIYVTIKIIKKNSEFRINKSNFV